MYQVNIGNSILYYPGSDDAAIYDTSLDLEVGLAGEFRFKVPPTNPVYSELSTGALITIFKDGKEFWRGDIRDIKTDFAKVADVYCLEDLAWLGDEFIAPDSITNMTNAQVLQSLISSYNTNRPAERQFTAGYITNVSSSGYCDFTTEYEWSILDDLRNCIAKDSGYLRVRRVTSSGVVTRYIDIVKLSDYGIQASQPIEYGYNLLDYVKDADYGELTNVLFPYGAELDTEIYEDYMSRLAGDTVTNSASVSTYGRHAKTVVFDGITDKPTLDALAQAYVSKYCQPQLTMQVKAVDLAVIDDVGEMNLGDSIRIIAAPFAVDQWLYLTQISRDIQNVDKNYITLSGDVPSRNNTITGQTISASEALKNLPTTSSILEAAKKNSIELLDGTNGGNIYFKFDSNGRIIEQGFTNNADLNQATAISRWNINGKAILTRDNPNQNWTVKVAETIDGGIVADFITTGHLSCDRLDGGTIRGQEIEGGTIDGAEIVSVGTNSWVQIEEGKIAGGYDTIIGLNQTEIQFAHSLDGYYGNMCLYANAILLKSNDIAVSYGKNDNTVYKGVDGYVLTSLDLTSMQYVEEIWDNGDGTIGWRTVSRGVATGATSRQTIHGIVT